MASGPGGGGFFPPPTSPFWPTQAMGGGYGQASALPPLFPPPPQPQPPPPPSSNSAFPALTMANPSHSHPHQQQPLYAHGGRGRPTDVGGGYGGAGGAGLIQGVGGGGQGGSAPTTEAKPGIGELVWLSSKAGLIKCDEAVTGSASVSFQLKDFCDQAVTDLTSVLRPGFFLQYWAHQQGGEGGLVATFVRPLPKRPESGQGPRVDAVLEAPAARETGPPQLPKDPYHLELEAKAIPVLLEIFKRNGLSYCQLSGFHTAISNCGDEELYRYVGTSSLKRRQFLERRTHVFHIAQTDTVSLQPPALYTTIANLNSFLLSHGGAAFLQQLFDHFGACAEIPLEAREMIGEGKTAFLRFLEAHPWTFAVFPSRVFVSARRQLIPFDYPTYMHENFGDQDPQAMGAEQPLPRGSRNNSSPGSNDRPPPTPTLPAAELLSSTKAFGSNTSLNDPASSNSIPPTPTSNGPPPLPPSNHNHGHGHGHNHWQPHPANLHHPPPPQPNHPHQPPPHRFDPGLPPPPNAAAYANAYSGRGSTDARSPTMGAPAPQAAGYPPPPPELIARRGWASQPTQPTPLHFAAAPPNQGSLSHAHSHQRIKRFTDVQAQTERPDLADFAAVLGLDLEMLARYLRPPMRDAQSQTGTGDSAHSSPGHSSSPTLSANAANAANLRPAMDEGLRSETGVLTGLHGLNTAYDPNLLSKGLLSSLNL